MAQGRGAHVEKSTRMEKILKATGMSQGQEEEAGDILRRRRVSKRRWHEEKEMRLRAF